MITLFENKIKEYNESLIKDEMTATEIEPLIENFYHEKELDNHLCDYKHIKPLINYYFHRFEIKENYSKLEHSKTLKEIFETIKECDDINLKNGIIIYILQLLVSFNIVSQDMDFSMEITDYVKSLSKEDRDNSYMIGPIFCYRK